MMEIIEELKNGARIMSIDARYLYSANKDDNVMLGYETTNKWQSDGKKRRVPLELYKITLSYSLALEKMYELNKEEFVRDDDGIVYTDAIINVTFNGSAKKVAEPKIMKNGMIKNSKKFIPEYRGSGKNEVAALREVDKLEIELTTAQLREYLYEEGFVLDGNRYVCYIRSASKAREGNMLFIKVEYQNEMVNCWARMGIYIPHNAELDVAGLKSYEALILSSIRGKVQIKPEEILLINDYKSDFIGKASVTRLNNDNRLYVKDDEVEYSNCIWDGMSLMDNSKFHNIIEFQDTDPEDSLNGKGFVLLRNRWFKSAAFNFNIQEFFKDYNIQLADIKKHGWTIARDIKDIKLIITPSSLKLVKMKKFLCDDGCQDEIKQVFEYWLKGIQECDCFGVVKAEHESPGHIRECNSQILMSLPLDKDDIKDLLETYEFPFMRSLHNDENNFLEFIGCGGYSDQMIYELAKVVPGFTRTELYLKYKNDRLSSYKENRKVDGIKIPNSDFCVCVSNPIEMIQYASGVEPERWVRVHMGREAYCSYYQDGVDLLAARNPCVCSGNIICLKNKYHSLLNYINLSNNIVVVNSIESDIMERASGMDFDSDQLWMSDNELLVEKGKYCEANCLTPVNKVPVKSDDSMEESDVRRNSLADFARVDNDIAQGKIGDIVNLGMTLQAYYWDVYFNDDIKPLDKKHVLSALYDNVSKLSSASGVEIDRAKKAYEMNTMKELGDIRKLGLLDNGDKFLGDYLSFKKLSGQRKTTISKRDLKLHPELLQYYRQSKDYEELSKERELTIEEVQDYTDINDRISSYLLNDHKKDDMRGNKKIVRPKYFKYAFPGSVEMIYDEKGMNCPMDHICTLIETEKIRKGGRDKKVEIMSLMKKFDGKCNDRHKRQIEKIAEEYVKYCNMKRIKSSKRSDMCSLTQKEYFEQCVKKVKDINLKPVTIVAIFNACYGSKQAKSHNPNFSKIKKRMLDIVFAAHKERVISCFCVDNAQKIEEMFVKSAQNNSRFSI